MKYGEQLTRASSGLDEARQAALNWLRYREQERKEAPGSSGDEAQRSRQEGLRYREERVNDVTDRSPSGQAEDALESQQAHRDRGHDYSL